MDSSNTYVVLPEISGSGNAGTGDLNPLASTGEHEQIVVSLGGQGL